MVMVRVVAVGQNLCYPRFPKRPDELTEVSRLLLLMIEFK